MHMADALLSPLVGGALWMVTTSTIAYSSIKVKKELDTKKIPLMGVMGAFIFAAQMINFTIPGTGSSGHLGGGMILAMLLGPYAGFLAIASVLVVQALFFADGGILALGCNIFNLGFFPCFIAYPFIYQKIKDDNPHSFKTILAIIIAVLVALQLGALSVVLETFFSGVVSLSFAKFLLFMQPIHLAIGIVEAIITVAIVNFIFKARPDLFTGDSLSDKNQKKSYNAVMISLLIGTLIIGGILSWFASNNPDGLEWSLIHTMGNENIENPDKAAIWPSIESGKTISGLVGSLFTLVIIVIVGVLLFIIRKKKYKQ